MCGIGQNILHLLFFKVLKWHIRKHFIYKTPYNFPNIFIEVNFI